MKPEYWCDFKQFNDPWMLVCSCRMHRSNLQRLPWTNHLWFQSSQNVRHTHSLSLLWSNESQMYVHTLDYSSGYWFWSIIHQWGWASVIYCESWTNQVDFQVSVTAGLSKGAGWNGLIIQCIAIWTGPLKSMVKGCWRTNSSDISPIVYIRWINVQCLRLLPVIASLRW